MDDDVRKEWRAPSGRSKTPQGPRPETDEHPRRVCRRPGKASGPAKPFVVDESAQMAGDQASFAASAGAGRGRGRCRWWPGARWISGRKANFHDAFARGEIGRSSGPSPLFSSTYLVGQASVGQEIGVEKVSLIPRGVRLISVSETVERNRFALGLLCAI